MSETITIEEIARHRGVAKGTVSSTVAPHLERVGWGLYSRESYERYTEAHPPRNKKSKASGEKPEDKSTPPNEQEEKDDFRTLIPQERDTVSRRGLIEDMKISTGEFHAVLLESGIKEKIGYSRAEADSILDTWEMLKSRIQPGKNEEALHPGIFHISTADAIQEERIIVSFEILRDDLGALLTLAHRGMVERS